VTNPRWNFLQSVQLVLLFRPGISRHLRVFDRFPRKRAINGRPVARRAENQLLMTGDEWAMGFFSSGEKVGSDTVRNNFDTVFAQSSDEKNP
jgi:hypothetical protein